MSTTRIIYFSRYYCIYVTYVAVATLVLASFHSHGLDQFVRSLASRDTQGILAPSIDLKLALVVSDVLLLNVSIWLPDVLVICRFSSSGPHRCGITQTMINATTPVATNPAHGSYTLMIPPVNVLQNAYMRSWHVHIRLRQSEFTFFDSPRALAESFLSFLAADSCSDIDLSEKINFLRASFSLRSTLKLDINSVTFSRLCLFYHT